MSASERAELTLLVLEAARELRLTVDALREIPAELERQSERMLSEIALTGRVPS